MQQADNTNSSVSADSPDTSEFGKSPNNTTPPPSLENIPNTSPPEEPKSKTPLVISIIIAAILLIGGAGFVAYSILGDNNGDTNKSSQEEAVDTTPSDDSDFVSEGEDKDGEIAPPLDDVEEEPVDIDGDNPADTGTPQ